MDGQNCTRINKNGPFRELGGKAIFFHQVCARELGNLPQKTISRYEQEHK
jgi:hypothetical protein